jgi:hypothetical protein
VAGGVEAKHCVLALEVLDGHFKIHVEAELSYLAIKASKTCLQYEDHPHTTSSMS